MTETTFTDRFNLLTQRFAETELAVVLGLSVSAVRKLRSGEQKMLKLDAALHLCDRVQVDPRFLAFGEIRQPNIIAQLPFDGDLIGLELLVLRAGKRSELGEAENFVSNALAKAKAELLGRVDRSLLVPTPSASVEFSKALRQAKRIEEQQGIADRAEAAISHPTVSPLPHAAETEQLDDPARVQMIAMQVQLDELREQIAALYDQAQEKATKRPQKATRTS